MSITTAFMKRLGLTHPIVQAPLAGGGDTPALVAAVCEAGGIGFIGAAYLTPAQIVEAVAMVRAKTSRPFGINLFAPLPVPAVPEDASTAVAHAARFYAELGLSAPAAPQPARNPYPEQFAAVLDTGVAAFSFAFGMVPSADIAAARARGMLVAATATTVAEAITIEHAGADAVVAQGSEAGGHRGTFAVDFAAGMIGTMSLVPQIVDAVRIPVVASGGIMDGRGIAAALALGAQAVQLGTAFLTCEEAGPPPAYKDAILAAHEDDTQVTRAFSGRPARGIVNRFMRETEAVPGAMLPFPLQNALTRPLRTAAAKHGRAEYLSLWAGQGVRMARRQSAGVLVARLAQETEETLRRLGAG
jgi:nitronate monooxygenase